MAQALLIDRQPLGNGCMEWWRLNAPQTRNALTDEMVQALQEACARAGSDAQLRLIVLTGNGGKFCAGGSLGSFASAIGQPWQEAAADDPLVHSNRAFGALLQALAGLPQLLVAAVQGAAMGGGVGLVSTADVVIASSDALFATPEVTLGIVPAQIAPFVVRRMGEARAREWLLGGQRWSAAQALEAGLVNTVLNAADAEDWNAQLQSQLRRYAQAAPGAVAATKQLLAQMPAHSLDDLLALAAQSFAHALRGPEAAAGLQAFGSKQAAPWTMAQRSTT
jgi:isohexenylglutaconyl-CoA hydratase